MLKVALAVDTTNLRQFAESRGFQLGRPVRPRPTPDGESVLFLRSPPRDSSHGLYEYIIATNDCRLILNPEMLAPTMHEISPEEMARRERRRVSLAGFENFHISPDGMQVLLPLGGQIHLYNRANAKHDALMIADGALDPCWSPSGLKVAYVRRHDLWVYDIAERKERPITKHGTSTLMRGEAEYIAQEEMHRYHGFWWSPDSRYLAYTEVDNTGVELWRVADPLYPDKTPQTVFYPKAGTNNAKVRLAVHELATGKTVNIKWDRDRFPYLAQVSWGNPKLIRVVVQSRSQKELQLLSADPETGGTRVLIAGHDDAWIELDPEMPVELHGGEGFLWTSQSAGAPRLEHRDNEGRIVRVVVPHDHGYQGLAAVLSSAREVIYRAARNPTETHLFRVSLDGGLPTKMTSKPGLYNAVFAASEKLFVREASKLDAMPSYSIRDGQGSLIAVLPSVSEEPTWSPNMQLVQVGEAPGWHACIVRPSDFKAGQTYPVLVDVYGGPTRNAVVATRRSRLMNQWLADQGFIVVAIDNRGTLHRGRDWSRAVAGKLGSVPLDDQARALTALGKQFVELDLNRVGIVGWSFGGYLAARAVLCHPEVFHAAVAGAPVTDWRDYNTHYTERYLGLPSENPGAYADESLLDHAACLTRPLLLIHGTADDNVYFKHSLRLADALLRAGKDFELLPLPGFTHMVPEAAVFVQLWARIARFFKTHLQL